MKDSFTALSGVLMALPWIALTIICWGMYGPVLHKGQAAMAGNRLKPLICVGIAYFVVAIVVPMALLAINGRVGGDWNWRGVTWSLAAGAAGAVGALGIILALDMGGKPIYVMPLVFGGAPIVNVFLSMYLARISFREVNPIFIAGMIMVAVGAAVVLIFAPRPKTPHIVSPVKQAVPMPIDMSSDQQKQLDQSGSTEKTS